MPTVLFNFFFKSLISLLARYSSTSFIQKKDFFLEFKQPYDSYFLLVSLGLSRVSSIAVLMVSSFNYLPIFLRFWDKFFFGIF
jgi:hypothetical protein